MLSGELQFSSFQPRAHKTAASTSPGFRVFGVSQSVSAILGVAFAFLLARILTDTPTEHGPFCAATYIISHPACSSFPPSPPSFSASSTHPPAHLHTDAFLLLKEEHGQPVKDPSTLHLTGPGSSLILLPPPLSIFPSQQVFKALQALHYEALCRCCPGRLCSCRGGLR